MKGNKYEILSFITHMSKVYIGLCEPDEQESALRDPSELAEKEAEEVHNADELPDKVDCLLENIGDTFFDGEMELSPADQG